MRVLWKMELVEHIKITRVNGVKLLQRARDSKIIVDGSLSIDVFFLIFSSKNPSSEETDVLTVRTYTSETDM